MRPKASHVLSALCFSVALAGPASAITGNYVQDFEHPFVGLVVFYDSSGAFVYRCSGALLTSKVFLTAGHCAGGGAASARVYFQQGAGAHYDPVTQHDPVTGYPDTCAAGTLGVVCATSHTLVSYGYPNAGFPETKDAGLVILDQAINLPEYGALATAGTLDRFATQRGQQDLTLTNSGYGLTYINPQFVTSFRERLMSTSVIENLRSHLTDGFNVQESNNGGRGLGGTCFGDSGGPVFIGPSTSNTIIAVTSFGLSANVCEGVGFDYRTDQAAFISWLQTTVGPTEFAKIHFDSP
jgi:hypothetical protein